MATWPATLPAPLIEGYGISPTDQTLRTDMEVGFARERRTTSQRADAVQVVWAFTAAQMAAFRAWFDGDGAGGAAWFGGINLDMGAGLAAYTARFVGAWNAERMETHWRVSATLDVRDA